MRQQQYFNGCIGSNIHPHGKFSCNIYRGTTGAKGRIFIATGNTPEQLRKSVAVVLPLLNECGPSLN